MKEWKQYKLIDILDKVIDYRGKTPQKTESGIPLITAKIIKDGRILPPNEFIAENNYEKWMVRGIPQEGDVVLTVEAPLGEVAQLDNRKIALAQRVVTLRGKKGVLDNTYLKYFLMSNVGQARLKARATGTTVTGIKQSELREVMIDCPDYTTQIKIASILNAIDAKIELNRQINDNLENQAKALYKSWFVDFEPFKDGNFVESDLGLIPEGWSVGIYEQIIKSTISGDWGKETPTGNYTHKVACVRGCDFQDMKIGVRGKTPERYILEKNYQAKKLEHNDILVEISGGTSTISTGRVCVVNSDLLNKYNHNIVCTNFCKVIRPFNSYAAYLYYSWQFKYDSKVMFGYENGTSGIKNFQLADFISKESVLVPPVSCVKEFQKLVDNILKGIQINGSEIMELELLRDTLLPKLMSGELKINEIDC